MHWFTHFMLWNHNGSPNWFRSVYLYGFHVPLHILYLRFHMSHHWFYVLSYYWRFHISYFGDVNFNWFWLHITDYAFYRFGFMWYIGHSSYWFWSMNNLWPMHNPWSLNNYFSMDWSWYMHFPWSLNNYFSMDWSWYMNFPNLNSWLLNDNFSYFPMYRSWYMHFPNLMSRRFNYNFSMPWSWDMHFPYLNSWFMTHHLSWTILYSGLIKLANFMSWFNIFHTSSVNRGVRSFPYVIYSTFMMHL